MLLSQRPSRGRESAEASQSPVAPPPASDLQIQLFEKLRIANALFGVSQNSLEDPLVPELKMIGERRKRDVAIESRELTKLWRNQDPSLPIQLNLVRATYIEGLKFSDFRVEAVLLLHLADQLLPRIGRPQLQ